MEGVIWPRKVEGPTAPNKLFEEPPPNADPRSEPLPCCKRTRTINMIARIMLVIIKKVISIFSTRYESQKNCSLFYQKNGHLMKPHRLELHLHVLVQRFLLSFYH